MHRLVSGLFKSKLRYFTAALGGMLSLGLISGCMGEVPTKPAYDDIADVYSKLQLNHETIILSVHPPYNNVQLEAIPINLLGETLNFTSDSVKYRLLSVLDTSIKITSNGQITGNAVTGGARVEASLTINGVLRTAVAVVMVRNELPVRRIKRIEFEPLPPDSSWRWPVTGSIGYEKWLRAYDYNEELIPATNYMASFSASDPRLVSSQFPNSGITLGDGYIYTRFYAYGDSYVDSTMFRRIEPPYKFIIAIDVFPQEGGSKLILQPDSINIKSGTTVYFFNPYSQESLCRSQLWCKYKLFKSKDYGENTLKWVDSLDIVFDAPDKVDTGRSLSSTAGLPNFLRTLTITSLISDGVPGNIPFFGGVFCERGVGVSEWKCGEYNQNNRGVVDPGYKARQFNTPGKIRFHSTKHPGVKGVIVVTE